MVNALFLELSLDQTLKSFGRSVRRGICVMFSFKKGRELGGLAWVLPSVGFMVLLTLYPLLYSIYISFLNYNLTYGPESISFAGIGNYLDLLDTRVLRALLRTLVLCVSSSGLSLALGFGLALALSKRVKGTKTFTMLLTLPLVLAPSVMGQAFLYMTDYSTGIINYTLLHTIGIRESWLGNPSLALLSIISMDVWQWTPFPMLIFLAGLRSLPPQPFEAARIDGASSLATLRYITLPLLKRAIIVALLFRLLFSFIVFDKIFVTTKGGPNLATETLVYHVYRTLFSFFDIGAAASMTIVLFAISLSLSMILMKLFASRPGY